VWNRSKPFEQFAVSKHNSLHYKTQLINTIHYIYLHICYFAKTHI